MYKIPEYIRNTYDVRVNGESVKIREYYPDSGNVEVESSSGGRILRKIVTIQDIPKAQRATLIEFIKVRKVLRQEAV